MLRAQPCSRLVYPSRISDSETVKKLKQVYTPSKALRTRVKTNAKSIPTEVPKQGRNKRQVNPKSKSPSHANGSRLVIERPLKRSPNSLIPNSILDIQAVEALFTEHGINPKHLNTVYTSIFRRGVTEFEKIPDIGRKAQELLAQNFVLTTSTVVEHKPAADDKGAKLVVRLQNGRLVETVIIKHKQHSTVCVSSQVGCAMGCKFCATGTMGLLANLTAGEILEQVWHCRALEPVRNVVFMGMGEPLDNYEELVVALRGLTQQSMFDLAFDKITVSTVGVVDAMRQLADECPKVNLALSLHAAEQGVREAIVPTSGRFTVEALGEALDYHHARTRRKVMLEYAVIGGVNDSNVDARNLGAFCEGRNCFVNLIPYNPTEVGDANGYKVPDDARVEEFAHILGKYGLEVKVRWSSTRGREVDGACGQLVLQQPELELK
mmetsp:Transcript_37005/g.80617  ORF Transcript_37005/g.80617 Transcript_37005/m.80617 type:complete len:436 (-) Transcript_37005:177-1484(-)|eukprot:CAMPEP_0118956070 /NCGR_PEP_ID=MMETSP1169-20130426/61011_1 /TAXON_ID=36882 /ORGANISM="Pyramimonas obovata, Strain CCMP722" /LENGTH=435 /DNA_ID=CAMNT_0006904027 /DNA_START=311 /DNA_END=1618 /DNA_ORIENTATION=-